jgi:hypothetical protein
MSETKGAFGNYRPSRYTKRVGPAHVAKRRAANKVAKLARRKNRGKK